MRKIDTRRFVRATRSTAREINRRIVLNLVREHQPISRAELARRMRVGRGMVTALVDELLAEGAIYEGAAIDAPRGRRPTMLHVRTRDRLVVGVDVRLSRTTIGLADFDGTPLAQETFDTVVEPTALVAELAGRIERLLAAHDAGGRCEGIGVAAPGMVDQRDGRVRSAPQLGWRDVPLRELLAAALGRPVQVESAPVACALARMWLDQRGRDAPGDFVYVSVGDGVGTGIVVGGQLVRGAGSSAGEFGHVPLTADGPRCLCGARGCLEAHASNLATLSRYLGEPLDPVLTPRRLQETGLDIHALLARARDGDARATAALDETGRHLGTGLAIVVQALNPSQIVVGGEITAAWDRIGPLVREAIAARALTAEAARTPVVAEPAGENPRLRGAAALVAAPAFAAPQLA